MNVSDLYGSDEDEERLRGDMMRDNAERVELFDLIRAEMHDSDERILLSISDDGIEDENNFASVMYSWRNNLLFEMWWL